MRLQGYKQRCEELEAQVTELMVQKNAGQELNEALQKALAHQVISPPQMVGRKSPVWLHELTMAQAQRRLITKAGVLICLTLQLSL